MPPTTDPVPSPRQRRALICGIGGQDGAYLAAHLLGLGYAVTGTSRHVSGNDFAGLSRLGIRDRVTLVPMQPTDFRSACDTVAQAAPDEIYNLAGQSSVSRSLQLPVETFQSIATATVHLLEAVRSAGRPIRLWNAGSAEIFGDTGGAPAAERTALRPRNPYGAAKATAFLQVALYREVYGVPAVTGILFNHESPLRPEQFVTQKIVAAACRIARGSRETLALGDLSVRRDWGWAPEYVVPMHRMLQTDAPEDFVIATGSTHSLEEFVAAAFAVLGLDWRRHVVRDAGLLRPGDIACSRADTARARAGLSWSARHTMTDVARLMVEARLAADPLPAAA
jgi:GDPmannose 4,6-dehydratase